jgi:type III secretion protein J
MMKTLAAHIKIRFLSLFLLLWLAACSSNVELITSVQEPEANEVLAALLQAGIPAQKIPGKDGVVSIQVESKDVSRALDSLNALGLPRTPFSGFGNVFKKDGLISSPLEERARYIYSLSQELENTLSQIDGVLSARVHVVLPERGAAGDPSLPSSASVFLKYRPDFDLDPITPQIRRLVTNSIPGLSSEKISVVLVPAQNIERAMAAPTLTSVFGFSVNSRSAQGLTATLIISWLLIVLLAAIISYIAWLKREDLTSLLHRNKR